VVESPFLEEQHVRGRGHLLMVLEDMVTRKWKEQTREVYMPAFDVNHTAGPKHIMYSPGMFQ
jgi:hypothetical protein